MSEKLYFVEGFYSAPGREIEQVAEELCPNVEEHVWHLVRERDPGALDTHRVRSFVQELESVAEGDPVHFEQRLSLGQLTLTARARTREEAAADEAEEN